MDSAELIEEYTEIKKIPVKSQSSASQPPTPATNEEGKDEKSSDSTSPIPEAEQSYEEKEVKKTRSKEILFKFEHHGFGTKQIEDFTNLEDDMCKFDNSVLEIKIMKNHLELAILLNLALRLFVLLDLFARRGIL